MFNLQRKLVHNIINAGQSSESSFWSKAAEKNNINLLFILELFFFLLSFLSHLTSACLQRWDVGPPSTSGLPDWHFPPIFYLAAAQPRAPPDGLCLKARPQASTPSKGPCCGTLLHHSTPPPPPPLPHSHKHAACSNRRSTHTRTCRQRFVRGGTGHSVFVFIHTTRDSFIVDLSYIMRWDEKEFLKRKMLMCHSELLQKETEPFWV